MEIINFKTVNSVIRALPNKTSEDADGFSYAILEGGGDVLTTQLCRLFQLSFTSGLIPSDWKKSVILKVSLTKLVRLMKSF